MANFFIRTDTAVTGPFSGVELREAALAGILGPDSVISGTPNGPWHLASNIGLFSEKRIALPHPLDVQVPLYQVRGMSGAFQGPFKLRELIGFAVRGMLPTNATLQSTLPSLDASLQPWMPVSRVQILSACLNGNLALIDNQGHVIRRAIHPISSPVEVHDARAPSEVAKNVDENDSTAYASTTANHESTIDQAVARRSHTSQQIDDDAAVGQPSAITRLFRSLSQRLAPSEGGIVSFAMRLVPAVVVLLVLAGSGTAYFYWQNLPMSRTQVLGDWIGMVGNEAVDAKPGFGISFRASGACVIFNPAGDSWSGEFEWVARQNDKDGFATTQSVTTTVDVAEPNHLEEDVQVTDGCLRFAGRGEDQPSIDGHLVRYVFVRREPTGLRLGYLTTVRFNAAGKSQQAAWVMLQKAGDLKPISEQADLLAPQQSKLTATELLATYGIPDEARRIYPFDLPGNKFSVEFSNSQLIRYDKTKLIIDAEGLTQSSSSDAQ